MPKQLIFAGFLEVVFILITSLFLVQPESMFKQMSVQVRARYSFVGWGMLCMTFVWSVIFGSLISFFNSQTL